MYAAVAAAGSNGTPGRIRAASGMALSGIESMVAARGGAGVWGSTVAGVSVNAATARRASAARRCGIIAEGSGLGRWFRTYVMLPFEVSRQASLGWPLVGGGSSTYPTEIDFSGVS